MVKYSEAVNSITTIFIEPEFVEIKTQEGKLTKLNFAPNIIKGKENTYIGIENNKSKIFENVEGVLKSIEFEYDVRDDLKPDTLDQISLLGTEDYQNKLITDEGSRIFLDIVFTELNDKKLIFILSEYIDPLGNKWSLMEQYYRYERDYIYKYGGQEDLNDFDRSVIFKSMDYFDYKGKKSLFFMTNDLRIKTLALNSKDGGSLTSFSPNSGKEKLSPVNIESQNTYSTVYDFVIEDFNSHNQFPEIILLTDKGPYVDEFFNWNGFFDDAGEYFGGKSAFNDDDSGPMAGQVS